MQKSEYMQIKKLQEGTKANTFSMEVFYQKLYLVFIKTPFLRRYILKIRRRLEIINVDDEYATRRYVEMYLNSIDLSHYITGGAQPKLNQKNLNKIEIPLPPLDEQERIVAILDRFDALRNDISAGLPAEIEARQKQYEYYRDKLLTFKEVTTV